MRRILIFLLLIPVFTYAQKMREHYAQKLNDRFNYSEAYPVWEELAKEVLSTKKGNWDDVRKAGETAAKLERYSEALPWYLALIKNKQSEENDYINTCKLLCLLNKHNQLTDIIQKARAKFPESKNIIKWEDKLAIIQQYLKDSANSSIKEFRPHSNAEEFSAVPYNKGALFVSTGQKLGSANSIYGWTGQNFTNIDFVDDIKKPDVTYDFWSTLFNKDLWKDIPNSKAHDGPVAFSPDYTHALVTRNQVQYDKKNGYAYSKLALYSYIKRDDKWEAEDVSWNSPEYSTGHAAMDSLGNLIFASDRPGGYGGVDLYKVQWKNGQWSAPVNLGPKINTEGNEMFPCIARSGALYFSSDGWTGIGGLDVFSSDYTNEPQHIGVPINSNGDDMISWYDDFAGSGFLTSNRKKQRDQIYRMSASMKGPQIALHVIACNGKALAGIKYVVLDKQSKQTRTVYTDANGNIQISAQLKKSYLLTFDGDTRYVNDTFSVTISASTTLKKEVRLRKKDLLHRIQISDNKGNPLEGVLLNMFNKSKSISNLISDNNGWIQWKESDANYDSLHATKFNFVEVGMPITAANCSSDTVEQHIVLPILKSELQINLSNILFDLNEFSLRPESKYELDKLVNYMKEHPDVVIELSSHTDSRGDNHMNMLLSEFRSLMCVKYIRNQGIPAENILAKGYGETQPKNHCTDGVPCSEEEYQQNRRTELKFIVK